jgi:DNA-binding LacI/PurR family transcriptional regulator
MRDIADACGVSLSTVSLVLSNNPRISTPTRDKVWASVKKFGYQPDIHARGLALRRSKTLSVVVPDIEHVFADVYFGQIVSGIYDAATEQEYKIILDVANERFVEAGEHLNVLRTRRVDGLLCVCASLNDTFLRDFEQEDFPFLEVNHYFPGSDLNYVATDYADSARQAAEHLLDLGHRHIGLITGTNVQTAVEFRACFEEACYRGGVEPPLPWADGLFHQQGGFEAMESLLAQNPDLTAIMAGNDKMAIGAMRYLLSKGITVPGEISVMGVDDIPSAGFVTPGLTTIRHDLYALGRQACRRILDLVENRIAHCREVLPVELMVRESTGPARA